MISSKTRERKEMDQGALDLTVKKCPSLSLSPNNFSTGSTRPPTSNKRILDLNHVTPSNRVKPTQNNKRPLRFQCKYCDYKAASTSLMQNHIYRHTDSTPYACAYCGHKSTTKSTIMVHIELCHPNMEVKIIENRVREQDFYHDVTSTETVSSPISSGQEPAKKKLCRVKPSDCETATIHGVAVPLQSLEDDDDDELENHSSPISDVTGETENCEPKSDNQEYSNGNSLQLSSPSLKLKFSPPLSPVPLDPPSPQSKESDSEGLFESLMIIFDRLVWSLL